MCIRDRHSTAGSALQSTVPAMESDTDDEDGIYYEYGFDILEGGSERQAWRQLVDKSGNALDAKEYTSYVTAREGQTCVAHFLDGTMHEVPGMYTQLPKASKRSAASMLKRLNLMVKFEFSTSN